MWVNWLAAPPETGADHQSEGTVWAEATLIPSSFSSQVADAGWAGAIALKRMDWPSAENNGASIISGAPLFDIATSCALLPSIFDTKSLFFPSAGLMET